MEKTKENSQRFSPKLAFLWPVLLMVIIFTFSAFSAEKSDAQSGFWVNIVTSVFPTVTDIDLTTTIIRKTAHFIEYALLGFLLARAYFKNFKKTQDFRMVLFSVLTATAYSITDEIHQAFVPGRSCEFRDICIDSIGATLGACICFLINKKRISKQK